MVRILSPLLGMCDKGVRCVRCFFFCSLYVRRKEKKKTRLHRNIEGRGNEKSTAVNVAFKRKVEK